MIAAGAARMLNPNVFVNATIVGKYGPSTGSLNEVYLSESAYDKAQQMKSNKNLKVKGVDRKPSKSERFTYVREETRARRTRLGKIRVDPTGYKRPRKYPGHLQTMESSLEKEKRLARSRNTGKATVLGGGLLKYGTPVLLIGWTVHDAMTRETGTRAENLEYGLGGYIVQDVAAVTSVATSGKTTALLTAGNFDWSVLF